MKKDNITFPQFLRTDFDNAEQIEQLINIIPSANEPFAADELYEFLYTALTKEEQQKHSLTSTLQNLREIMFVQKDLLKRITSELNSLIKRYNDANKNPFELNKLNTLIEKEIKFAGIKIATNSERSKFLSLFNLQAKNLRQYFYINLVFIIDSSEEFYLCTHCKKWVYNPNRKQIATFKKTGTILHEECRKGRKSQKSSQRRKEIGVKFID